MSEPEEHMKIVQDELKTMRDEGHIQGNSCHRFHTRLVQDAESLRNILSDLKGKSDEDIVREGR